MTLPKTHLNYKYEQEKIQWPKGYKYITNKGDVYLMQRGQKFAVVYGLSVDKDLAYENAALVFTGSVRHQAQFEI